MEKKSPNRDALDFAHEPVGRLFRQMFLPTLLGLVSMVVLNITDGAFVGHGVGSDALAAVNIVAPLFLLSGGMGLMLGIGCSVVASIHLSHDNRHAADLNITQGILASLVSGIVLSAVVLSAQEWVCRLFGCTDRLMPLACSYLRWIALFMPLNMFGTTAMFMVRLDGSPRFAMAVNCTAAGLNILLDWLFVFPLQMGLEGAAIATSLSFGVCTLPVLYYVARLSRSVRLCRIKLSATSRRLTLRNLGYQCQIGFSALLGDLAIASVLIVGNYNFVKYLGEDGVAAYSVACYCLPIAFMMGNAIVQSVQPIVSFAYGHGDSVRMRAATRLAVGTAVGMGLLGMTFLGFEGGIVSSTFLPVSWHASAHGDRQRRPVDGIAPGRGTHHGVHRGGMAHGAHAQEEVAPARFTHSSHTTPHRPAPQRDGGRSALQQPTHRAAMPDAVRCDARCTALRHLG